VAQGLIQIALHCKGSYEGPNACLVVLCRATMFVYGKEDRVLSAAHSLMFELAVTAD